jgi:hypothetical protein
MPFDNCPGYAFSTVSIRNNAPPFSGVYGLSNDHEWVFVGVADDIRAALLDHLREAGTLLKMRLPTGFKFELCNSNARLARQDRLVLEMEPVCNRRSR